MRLSKPTIPPSVHGQAAPPAPTPAPIPQKLRKRDANASDDNNWPYTCAYFPLGSSLEPYPCERGCLTQGSYWGCVGDVNTACYDNSNTRCLPGHSLDPGEICCTESSFNSCATMYKTTHSSTITAMGCWAAVSGTYHAVDQSSTSASASASTSSSSSDTANKTSSPKYHPQTGAIIGGVIGGVILVALIIGAIIAFLQRRRKSNDSSRGNIIYKQAPIAEELPPHHPRIVGQMEGAYYYRPPGYAGTPELFARNDERNTEFWRGEGERGSREEWNYSMDKARSQVTAFRYSEGTLVEDRDSPVGQTIVVRAELPD